MHSPRSSFLSVSVALDSFAACSAGDVTAPAHAPMPGVVLSSGSGGGGTQKPPAFDHLKVTKCYTNATTSGGGQMLITASSSDATARLFAYRPGGSLIGQVQNGGGSRYGGTVMPYQTCDQITVTIRSSSGRSITVPMTPFHI